MLDLKSPITEAGQTDFKTTILLNLIIPSFKTFKPYGGDHFPQRMVNRNAINFSHPHLP